MAAGDIIVISEDASGKSGVNFDGVDDYILVDAHAVARVAANDTTGTYSAWIYIDSLLSSKVILSAGDNDSTTEYFLLYYNTANYKLSAELYVGSVAQWGITTPSNSVVAKTWTHVSLVQNGVSPELYINGLKLTIAGTVTDTTAWYDELANCDKFAIGVKESNGTHTLDFKGGIRRVKYWNRALTAAEVAADFRGESLAADATYLQLNILMDTDGTTDTGAGTTNGTLTGNAYWIPIISNWSRAVDANTTGHAAEKIDTVIDGNKFVTLIKRGD